MNNKNDTKEFLIYYKEVEMQKQKLIKPKVDILSVEPKYIDKFWPLCDFMVAEALQYSGGFADATSYKRSTKKR